MSLLGRESWNKYWHPKFYTQVKQVHVLVSQGCIFVCLSFQHKQVTLASDLGLATNMTRMKNFETLPVSLGSN